MVHRDECEVGRLRPGERGLGYIRAGVVAHRGGDGQLRRVRLWRAAAGSGLLPQQWRWCWWTWSECASSKVGGLRGVMDRRLGGH